MNRTWTGYGSTVFRSTNMGESWTAVTGLPQDQPFCQLRWLFAGANLFAGTERRRLSLNRQRHRLETAFNRRPAHLGRIPVDYPQVPLTWLAVSGTNASMRGLTLTQRVFLRTNNGTSWTTMSKGLPRYDTMDITLLHLSLSRARISSRGQR